MEVKNREINGTETVNMIDNQGISLYYINIFYKIILHKQAKRKEEAYGEGESSTGSPEETE